MSFAPNDPVRVKTWNLPGHIRTPHYLRGKEGIIERALGPFKNPEQLAYGVAEAQTKMLVRVRYTMADVWGDTVENPSDTLDAEIYDHWLEPA